MASLIRPIYYIDRNDYEDELDYLEYHEIDKSEELYDNLIESIGKVRSSIKEYMDSKDISPFNEPELQIMVNDVVCDICAMVVDYTLEPQEIFTYAEYTIMKRIKREKRKLGR